MFRSWPIAAALLLIALLGPPAGAEPGVPAREAPAAVADLAEVLRAGARPLATARTGRAVPAGPGFTHQWPGITATARFEGDALIAAFDDALNRYRIVFDDGSAHVLVRPGRQALRWDGLGPGPHEVRLEKLSESIAGPGTFAGFFVPAGGRPLAPPAPRARQIEFIGDSDTVGYGDVSATRECTGEEVFLTTDTQAAYGPRLARRLNADFRIAAYSGIGLIRNYGGANPQIDMTRLYPRMLFDDPAPDNRAGWAPQIIVLALGSNDFAPAVGPGEAWPDQEALRADFQRAYDRFLTALRAANPEAFFLIAVIEDYDPGYAAAHRAVVAAARARGETRLDLITFPRRESTGCHWHPSLADHARMEETLAAYIEARPELWQGR